MFLAMGGRLSLHWARLPRRLPAMIRRFLVAATCLAPALLPVAADEPVIPPHTTLTSAALADDEKIGSNAALAVDDHGGLYLADYHGPTPPSDRPWLREDLAVATLAQSDELWKKWQAVLPPRSEVVPRLRHFPRVSGDGPLTSVPVAIPADPPLNGPTAALLVADGRLYFGGTPVWWVLPTAKPAKLPEKPLLSGIGLRLASRGRGATGLTPGPDGRLYGAVGDGGLHVTTAAGAVVSLPDQGCVFRMEADGTGFEIFHRGLRRPRGVVFDEAGNPFTVDTGSGHGDPTRLIYLVEAGDSGWRSGYEALLDGHKYLGLREPGTPPWTAEKLWEMPDRRPSAHPLPPVAHLDGFPSALTIHPGTGLLEQFSGCLLLCQDHPEASQSGIVALTVEPDGAGMKLTNTRTVVGGRELDAAVMTWDGALVIARAGTGHLNILSAKDGHQWQAEAAAEAPKIAAASLDTWDTARLAPLLRHPDQRIRLRAQLALTRKEDGIAAFAAAIQSGHRLARLHGIWGIGILSRLGRGVPAPEAGPFAPLPNKNLQVRANSLLASLIEHRDPEVRAQALKSIGEGPDRFLSQNPSLPQEPNQPNKLREPEFISSHELPLARLLSDPNPQVRYYAALAIGKFKAIGYFGPVCDFLASDLAACPYLRHAGSYALERLAASDPMMLVGLDRHPSRTTRLGAALALRRMGGPEAAAFINDADHALADESIRAVTDLDLPDSRLVIGFLLDDPSARPWSPYMWRRLIHNAWRMGGPQNATRLLSLPGHPAVPEAVQLEALALCQDWAAPSPVHLLTGRWSPVPERDPMEIKATLTAALPRFAELRGAVRKAAEKLATTHGLTLPEPPKPKPASPPAKPAPPAPQPGQ
jgi:quinoprotein glucose dehydrogenase